MKRHAMNYLLDWKDSKNRKPLVIRGARQVGKTWLMQSFGRQEYEDTIYVNFEREKNLRDLFTADFDPDRIINALQVHASRQIESGTSLIVLDEIQEAKDGITALKYFYEDRPDLHVICAGSILGLALNDTSFPVGKVDFLNLYPMNFREFLLALGEVGLVDLLEEQNWTHVSLFKNKLIDHLKHYYVIGGMPEAVQSYVSHSNIAEVRKIHENILIAFEADWSKHAPSAIIPRIRMLWNSIPGQLSKENKKFIYGAIRSGARSRDYELALNWLKDYGLIHIVYRITKPGLPLKSYIDDRAFKLYILDTGLLCTLSDLDVKTILQDNQLFTEFKGALTEQYVLQELIANNYRAYYWSADRSSGEVDFLIQINNRMLPIEVKAKENLMAKSLKFFHKKFKPEKCLRTSLADFRDDDWLVNTPLYGLGSYV